MPCQTQSSQTPQQPTTVLPQNLPQTQADWQRFLQRMNELLGSINNAQYTTGVNAVPTEYAVYDGTALPSLRITGATSAFDTSHVQFGAGSLKLTATASTVTVELAASGYPITLHPNWKWIASLFLLTSASTIAGKLSVVTPAQQYDVDISGTPGASWSRLYGDYDLTADASTSCTLLLTLTGVTVGQVFNLEGWMLEPSQGAVLPSPFIMTSGPRTWTQVVNDGTKPDNNANYVAGVINSYITELSFAAGIGPVNIVSSLPALPNGSYPDGSLVVLTTDHKLYRNSSSAWTKAVDGADIIANSITAGSISAGAINASAIAAGAVTANAIAAGAVQASAISVTTLSAISANLGTVTAGTLQDSAGKFVVNLSSQTQTIKDGSNTTRLLIGNLGSDYGIQVFSASGAKIFDASQGAWDATNNQPVVTTANNAQSTANTANTTANTAITSVVVQNANFTNGTSYWTLTPSSDFYQETGTNNPNPNGNTYLVHQGVSGESYANAVSQSMAPVVPGQTVTAIMCLEEFSANSGAAANTAIFWYTASGGYVGESASTMTCGPTGTATRLNSKVVAQAPATAAFACAGVEYHNHTSGYINATTASLTLQPASVDETPDGTNYRRTVQNSGSAIVIGNGNFESPANPDGSIPGWSAVNGATISNSTTSPYSGSQCLEVVGSGTANFGARSPAYQCAAGDTIYAQAKGYASTGNGATLGILFYGASGVISTPNVATGSYGAWLPLALSAVAPAGVTHFYLQLYNSATSGLSRFDEFHATRVVSLDNEVADGTTYARIYGSELSSGTHRIGVAGSGYRVGDQRNLLQRTVTNYPSKVSPGISYSASAGSPATATITAAAFTALLGSVSVAYNASSASVTGTSGTNANYYLYFNDPSYSGGTKTLVATTNQNDLYSGDGYVYVGYVTVAFPSSGSGSGGGTGCPEVEEPVIRRLPDGSHQVVRAGDIDVGDDLLLFDGRWGRVSYSERKSQPGVHVIGEDDSSITCSESAPLETDDGPCVRAADVEGLSLRHRRAGSMRIKAVIPLGPIWVQHITCEDACFVVGDYSHHNAKPP